MLWFTMRNSFCLTPTQLGWKRMWSWTIALCDILNNPSPLRGWVEVMATVKISPRSKDSEQGIGDGNIPYL